MQGFLNGLSNHLLVFVCLLFIECNCNCGLLFSFATHTQRTAINAVKLIDEKRLYFDKGLKACLLNPE